MANKPSSPTWSDAVEKYAAYLREDRKSSLTTRNYTDDVHFFGAWYRSQRDQAPDLGRLTKGDLSEWTEHMIDARQMAPQTVNRKLSAIASFLKWAQSEGLSRPIGIPKKERIEKLAPKWLERNERNALLREVEDSGNQLHIDIVTVLLNTGLRVSELAALKWTKITQSERKGEMKVEGKGRKKRTIELNLKARAAFTSLGYARYRGQDRHVIQSQHGPMTVRGIQYVVEHYGPKAELDHLTVHMLRHTFAHDLIVAGVPLHIVRDILGHESINTTTNYVTPSAAERQAAVEKLSSESSEADDNRPQRTTRHARRA
jgi:site-specific recombinase XerD